MVFGLPAIGESNWGQKILDSINAVKATADGAVPKWQPDTVYAAANTVQAPDGSLVKAKVARTSSGSYSTTPDSPPVLGAPTTATTGGTIAAGTTYYYKATALSALGETLASAEVSRVIAAALATPVNAAFTTATTGGTLAAGTYSYRVSATNALGQTLASTATTQVIPAALAAPVLNAPTTATTGGTLAAGTYYYKITATNAVGETIGSNEVSQVTTGTTSTVGLTWAAITGATGYKIYRATTTGGQSTSPALVASVGAVTSYTDTGTAVSAGAVPATNTTATTTNTITVNWGAVTGATGYKVYGRVGGSELLIATVGAVTTYTDTGSVTPAGALPTANTTATNTNTVGLSWAAVTGATGYKIYRATTTGGQSTSPALLATLGAVTTYTDTGNATTAGAVPTTNTANERAFWQSVNTYPATQAQTELSATIASTIANLSAYYVTPQQFGAVGDGVTDDTAAVQAAIDAALTHTDPANGEKPPYTAKQNASVFFPLGTYRVGELNVPGSVAMWGVGPGTYGTSTLLQRTEGQSIIRLKGDTDGGLSQSSVIEHLSFKSGSATSAGVAQIITDTAIGSNSVYIRNCWFKTPEKYGVWITQGNDIKIEGCTFDVSPFHGVRFGSGANAVTDAAVTGCTFYDIALNCIELDNVTGLTVTGNRAFGRLSSPPTTSRFLGAPSGGATRIRHIALGTNELQSLGALATLPTLAYNISISGGSCRDLFVSLVEITGGGVMYGLAITGLSVFNETFGFSAGAAISGAGCGLQGSVISLNTFYSGVATALLMSLSDARVIDNNLKGNARIGFTAEHNLAAPASNGF